MQPSPPASTSGAAVAPDTANMTPSSAPISFEEMIQMITAEHERVKTANRELEARVAQLQRCRRRPSDGPPQTTSSSAPLAALPDLLAALPMPTSERPESGTAVDLSLSPTAAPNSSLPSQEVKPAASPTPSGPPHSGQEGQPSLDEVLRSGSTEPINLPMEQETRSASLPVLPIEMKRVSLPCPKLNPTEPDDVQEPVPLPGSPAKSSDRRDEPRSKTPPRSMSAPGHTAPITVTPPPLERQSSPTKSHHSYGSHSSGFSANRCPSNNSLGAVPVMALSLDDSDNESNGSNESALSDVEVGDTGASMPLDLTRSDGSDTGGDARTSVNSRNTRVRLTRVIESPPRTPGAELKSNEGRHSPPGASSGKRLRKPGSPTGGGISSLQIPGLRGARAGIASHNLSSGCSSMTSMQMLSSAASSMTGAAMPADWWFADSEDEMDEMVDYSSEDKKRWRVPRVFYICVRLWWDLLWSTALVYELWVTSFQLVFLPDAKDLPTPFAGLSLVATVIFGLDIVFNVAIWFVARDFTDFRFWIGISLDLIATFPFNALLGSASQAAMSAKFLRILRIPRMWLLFNHIKVIIGLGALGPKKHKNSRFAKLRRRLSEWRKTIEELLPLEAMSISLMVMLLLAVLAHAHGCIWAALKPEWIESEDWGEALDRYARSCQWAYSAMMFGSSFGDKELLASPQLWILDLLITTERLALAALAFSRLFFYALVVHQQNANLAMKRNGAIKYLKKHGVSIRTQLLVMGSVQETENVKRVQNHFNDLMLTNLPLELRRTVRSEIWASHLMSMGLIMQAKNWSETLLDGLAQIVHEEVYPSKSILFNEGDPIVNAQCILQGTVVVMKYSPAPNALPEPPFTRGMWLGEKSLVNTGLGHNGMGVATSMIALMVLPAEEFRESLEECGICEQYDQFCKDQLWRGFCGRCGDLGQHFSNECPLISVKGRQEITISRDVRLFLQKQELMHLRPVLTDLGVISLEDLEALKIDDVDEIEPLSPMEWARLSPESIKMFREKTAEEVWNNIQHNLAVPIACNSFVFLSHYKVEAGTEAALMRCELEQLMKEESDPKNNQFAGMNVFLDSEDLTDLDKLVDRVTKSANLVVLLTTGVLTRPWCLIEIVAAVRSKVPLVPVKILKPGNDFEFPDEAFYQALLDRTLLGEEDSEMCESRGFPLEEIKTAVQDLAKQIALNYSPHRASNIRWAESQAVFRRCVCSPAFGTNSYSTSSTAFTRVPSTPFTNATSRRSLTSLNSLDNSTYSSSSGGSRRNSWNAPAAPAAAFGRQVSVKATDSGGRRGSGRLSTGSIDAPVCS